MTHQTLASCLIIPQHLSIAIDGGIGSTRLYQIERGIRLPHEDEVIVMAKEYDAPELITYYCKHVCAIGAYCKKDIND